MKNRPEKPLPSGEAPIDPLLLSHFRTCTEPLALRRDGKPVQWQDEALHRAAFASDPELYSLHAFAEHMQPWQQARILFLLLATSRRTLSTDLRAHLERITLFLLATLPTELVLTVFLALRRARANHRHTVRAMLSYLLQHSQIDALIRARHRTIQDCLEHALGKAQARHFGYHGPRAEQEPPIPRLLRRYGGSEAQTRRLIASLYFGGQSAEGSREFVPESSELPPSPNGVLVPLLLKFYRSGTSPTLVQRLEAAVVDRATELPELTGRVALILDASASMRGSREQEFAPIALAVAFERVLQAKCTDLRTYTIGGFGWPPAPEGPSDFGRALIDALEADPDLVLFVTDNYENQNLGDAARIQATLRKLYLSTPILCCRIDSERQETVTQGTQPSNLPMFLLRSECEFEAALQICALWIAPAEARKEIVDRLHTRQHLWEQEVYGWTAVS